MLAKTKNATRLVLPGGFYGTPLHAAVACQRRNAIKMLLDAGADVNIPDEHG